MSLPDIELRKQLPANFGYSPMLRLRWRFVFSDGRPDKIGGWNSTSQNPCDMAAFIDKKNLLMAIIEGEKIGAWTVKTMLEIDGHMYATAKWVTALSAPMFVDKEYKAPGSIVGLEFQTGTHGITVFVDGQIKSRNLEHHDTQFKITEHSVGGN